MYFSVEFFGRALTFTVLSQYCYDTQTLIYSWPKWNIFFYRSKGNKKRKSLGDLYFYWSTKKNCILYKRKRGFLPPIKVNVESLRYYYNIYNVIWRKKKTFKALACVPLLFSFRFGNLWGKQPIENLIETTSLLLCFRIEIKIPRIFTISAYFYFHFHPPTIQSSNIT